MNRLAGLPPGSILQLLHFERRIKLLEVGKFVEVGPGAGDITAILLELGWVGRLYDLNQKTIDKLRERFTSFVDNGALTLVCGDFVKTGLEGGWADLFVSCMVLEHIPKSYVNTFLDRAIFSTNDEALLITIVPGSPSHWGIEDEIAGHVERYTFESLASELKACGIETTYRAGLTYPLSNLLLPLSNYLVQRSESHKRRLSLKKRTSLSGNRNVLFKTHFPKVVSLLLNKTTLKPFDWLQKKFRNSRSSLVIYHEGIKVRGSSGR